MNPFLQSARSLPRSFWILAGATFVNRFGVFVWPFLTVFITRSGNTAIQAGFALSAYSLGSFLGAALGGWLADRLGRNITMAASSLGGAACMMAMSQGTSWQALALIAFATGLVSESGHPAASALVQDIVPKEQQITAFAVLRFAVNLGWSLGPATAGFLLERSFFWLFAVDAATSALFGLIALFFLPRGSRTKPEQAGWSFAWSSIRGNKPFLALFAACLCVSWIFRQSSSTFPLHFERSGLSMDWCGIVLAVNGVMICLAEIPLTAATSRLPVRGMIALGYVLMGGSFLLFLGSGSLVVFFAVMVVFTLGEMFSFSRQQAYAASLAPDDMRGRYAGFLSLAWCLGGIVSSTASLWIYEAHSATAWVVAAMLGLAGGGMLGLFGSQNRPPTAQNNSAEP